MNKDEELQEYLRRNLLHCAAIGARADAQTALARLKKMKRHPLWLLNLLEGVIERAQKVQREMAAHRDELSPYRNMK